MCSQITSLDGLIWRRYFATFWNCVWLSLGLVLIGNKKGAQVEQFNENPVGIPVKYIQRIKVIKISFFDNFFPNHFTIKSFISETKDLLIQQTSYHFLLVGTFQIIVAGGSSCSHFPSQHSMNH